MKDTKSVLLLLLCAGLIGTWIYHLYDKTVYSNRIKQIYVKDSAAVAEGIRDSLQKIYTVTINDLDTQLDSTKNKGDSLRNVLGTRINEINKLKNEIGNILKNRNSNQDDMRLARTKISQLQQKIDELRSQNTSMESERIRLNTILEQLGNEMKGLETNIKKLDDENKILTEKINLASTFVASELRLSAVDIRSSKQQETSVAKKTDKLVVSFFVQNNINDYSNAEVAIAITKPDGQVLQDQMWESGNMATRNGLKDYSRKLRFEYSKGEQKKLFFSLDADSYQKGNYKMELYHNGSIIGQTVKTLY